MTVSPTANLTTPAHVTETIAPLAFRSIWAQRSTEPMRALLFYNNCQDFRPHSKDAHREGLGPCSASDRVAVLHHHRPVIAA